MSDLIEHLKLINRVGYNAVNDKGVHLQAAEQIEQLQVKVNELSNSVHQVGKLYNESCMRVYELESANEWIDVNDDRKPEPGQDIIVLREYLDIEALNPVTNEEVKNYITNFSYEEDAFSAFDEIIAWMPNHLPKP